MTSSPRAQAPLDFLAPPTQTLVTQNWAIHFALVDTLAYPIAKIEVRNLSEMRDCYTEFMQGKSRLLIAFRHPSVNDPFCLGSVFWQQLPAALKTGLLQPPPRSHAHFMYDRGIPLWGGKLLAWLFPRLGGTSIQRGKLDRPGLRSARSLLLDGDYPLVAAPEGATNGHNEIISPLEPGIAQLAFWCVEDLKKAQRTETVKILPLGIQYFYLTPPWAAIEALLSELEADCGISPDPTHDLGESHLYQRLLNLGQTLLDIMEDFYRTIYDQSLPTVAALQEMISSSDSPDFDPNELLSRRLQNLLNAALAVGEEYFHLTPKGNIPDRCRRLEQAGWDQIYREDFRDEQTVSPVQRGLADRVAEESALRTWHMRLVENFVAVTGRYVREKPTVERFADTLLLLWMVVTRMQGTLNDQRPQLGEQRAVVTVGDPITVEDYLDSYRNNRKQAIADMTQLLHNRMVSLIIR